MARKQPKGKEWLALKACADRLHLTSRQVENLVTLGLPREQRDGAWRYPFPEVFDWYVGHKVDAAKAKRESSTRKAADERLANVKAQIAELELAKATGDVVTMDYLEEQISRIVGRLAARCRNLPGKWAPTIVGMRNIAEAQVKLEAISVELLSSLSETGDDPELDDPDLRDDGSGEAGMAKTSRRSAPRRARAAA